MQKVIDKTTVLVYNIIVVMSEDVTGYMQTYRSGHNGADSKFYGCLVVSSAGKPFILRVFKIKNRIFFSVLSCFSLQKFFDRNLSEEKAD